MTSKDAACTAGSPVFIAVAARDHTIKAKVGDAEMKVPLSKDAHVLVERVTRYTVEGSFEYGALGIAQATIPRSILSFPSQFYERYR